MKENLFYPVVRRAIQGDNLPVETEDSRKLTRREVFGTLGVVLGLVTVAEAGAHFLAQREPGSIAPLKLDRSRQLTAFHLTERSGQSITDADLAGKILVVNFVFTSCSLKCREVNDRMTEIQQSVREMSDVQLVSLTVDPGSDTPTVLRKFADSFQADARRWLFLTGEKAELYHLMESSFIPRSPELADLIPGGFINTDRIMLVAPTGEVCSMFQGLQPGVAKAVVTEINRIRKANHPK